MRDSRNKFAKSCTISFVFPNSTFGFPADLCRKITANQRIVPHIPDDNVAVVPAAEADEEVAVAREADIRDADFVRLVAAPHRAFLVIPHNHHGLR